MKQILSLNKTNFYMMTTNGTVFLPHNTEKKFFIYTDIEDEVYVFGDIPNYAYDFLTKCMNDYERFSLYVRQTSGELIEYILILNHAFKTKAEMLRWIKKNLKVKSRYIIIDYKTTTTGVLPHED